MAPSISYGGLIVYADPDLKFKTWLNNDGVAKGRNYNIYPGWGYLWENPTQSTAPHILMMRDIFGND